MATVCKPSVTIYAIAHRRWWLGGGFDVLAHDSLTRACPATIYRLAWFRYQHHADIFVALMSGAITWRP